MGWRDRASCAGLGLSNLFFPDDNGSGAPLSAVYRTCYECPVRMECRVAGIAEEDGIWGNSSPKERRPVRQLLRPSFYRHTKDRTDDARDWSDTVLYDVDRGMDLVTALQKHGASIDAVRALYAASFGDRFALANKQKNVA